MLNSSLIRYNKKKGLRVIFTTANLFNDFKKYSFVDDKMFILNIPLNNALPLETSNSTNLYYKSLKRYLFKSKKKGTNNFYYLNNFIFFYIMKFINILMKCGKKDKAISIFKKVLFNLSFFFPARNPLRVIFYVFLNLKFVLALKKKKVAGRVHHVPFFLNNIKQVLVGLKLFLYCTRLSVGKGICGKLTNEFVLIFNKDLESAFIKKKRELYNLALDNKYYVKFL